MTPPNLNSCALFNQREIIDHEEIAFALKTGKRRAAEIGAGVAHAREFAGRVPGRRVVPGGLQQGRPSEAAGDVRKNVRLVHAIADAQLVERSVRQGRGPVAEDIPERTAEGLPRLERFERRRGARRCTAHVQVASVGVRVAEIGAIVLVDVRVDLDHADGFGLPRRNHRGAHRLTPVVRNAEYIRRREIQTFDAAEVEDLVLDHRAADEATPPLLREWRRRVEKNRVLFRVVAAGERRLVELVVAEESIRARVEPVRAAARDDVHHAAGRLPVLGAERIRQHLELLNPVLWKVVRLSAVELHLVRCAVDDDPVAEWTLARDGHAGALSRAGGVRRRGPRGNCRERAEVARDRRQIVDLLVGDDRSERALRFNGDRPRDDVHGFRNAANLHDEVDGKILPNAEVEHLFAGDEACQFGEDLVLAGPQVGQEVTSFGSGHDRLNSVGFGQTYGDGDARQRTALLVEDGAPQRAERCLPGRQRRKQQHVGGRESCLSCHLSSLSEY